MSLVGAAVGEGVETVVAVSVDLDVDARVASVPVARVGEHGQVIVAQSSSMSVTDVADTNARASLTRQGQSDVAEVLRLFAAERSPATRRAYDSALRDFASFTGASSVAEALAAQVAAGPVEAHRVAYAWLAHLEARGLAPATRALRLSALQAAFETLRRLGLSPWPLRVRRPRATPLRDVAGPGVDGTYALLEAARAQAGVRGHRDFALVSLLALLALRRGEVERLNVGDFDAVGARLRIRGKGRDDFEFVTLPDEVRCALSRYVEERAASGDEPLFANLDRRSRERPARLSASGIFRIVGGLAQGAGLAKRVSPHRLRHSAITAALDGTDGDVRRVRAFSRHAKLETVLVYDDRRRDVGADVARIVTAAVNNRPRAVVDAPGDTSQKQA